MATRNPTVGEEQTQTQEQQGPGAQGEQTPETPEVSEVPGLVSADHTGEGHSR